jgi:peptidoglycan/LPS O-acetylase OafA/YrhL
MRPSASTPEIPQTFVSVQILRAVAAILVVALHATLQAIPFGGGQGFLLGNAGVDIFFPISGFVMVVSTAGRNAGPTGAGGFALARILRIVPIYWLLTLAKAAAAAIRPEAFPGYALSAKGLIAALFFIPLHDAAGALIYPPIKPGWTLNLEMFYYALIVTVLLFSRRIALYVPLTILAVVGLSALVAPAAPLFSGENGWGSAMALEFAAGMLLGQAVLSLGWIGRLPWLALAAGVAIYLLVPEAQAGRVIAWGVPGVLFLWACVGLEPAIAGRRGLKGLKLLGDASYSIYLTHALSQPVLSALAGAAIAAVVGPGGLIAFLIVVPTLAAVAFHLTVEKPLTRLFKRTLAQRRRAAVAVSA